MLFVWAIVIAMALVQKGRAFYYVNSFALSWFVCDFLQMIYVTEDAYSIKPWMGGAFAEESVMIGSWGNPSEFGFLAAAGIVVVFGDVGAHCLAEGKSPIKWIVIAVLAILAVVHTIISWVGGEHGGVHFGNQAFFGLTLGLGLGLILHGVAREPLTKAGDEGKGRPVLIAAIVSVVMFLVLLITYFIVTSSDDAKNRAGGVFFMFAKYGLLFDDTITAEETLWGENLSWGALVIAPAGAAVGLMIGDKLGKNDGKGKSSMAPLWHIVRFVILVVLLIPTSIWMMYGRWFAD